MNMRGVVTTKFWERTQGCKHENLSPNYLEFVGCGTPYCCGWETHCLDCGAFIIECGCGFLTSISGWPESRHRKIRRKKEAADADTH